MIAHQRVEFQPFSGRKELSSMRQTNYSSRMVLLHHQRRRSGGVSRLRVPACPTKDATEMKSAVVG